MRRTRKVYYFKRSIVRRGEEENPGLPTEPTSAYQNLKFGTLSVFAQLSGISCSSLVCCFAPGPYLGQYSVPHLGLHFDPYVHPYLDPSMGPNMDTNVVSNMIKMWVQISHQIWEKTWAQAWTQT